MYVHMQKISLLNFWLIWRALQFKTWELLSYQYLQPPSSFTHWSGRSTVVGNSRVEKSNQLGDKLVRNKKLLVRKMYAHAQVECILIASPVNVAFIERMLCTQACFYHLVVILTTSNSYCPLLLHCLLHVSWNLLWSPQLLAELLLKRSVPWL